MKLFYNSTMKKLDFTKILSKTAPEFVQVIRQVIKQENLFPIRETLICDEKKFFDVAVMSETRFIIFRFWKKNGNQAFIKEFAREEGVKIFAQPNPKTSSLLADLDGPFVIEQDKIIDVTPAG